MIQQPSIVLLCGMTLSLCAGGGEADGEPDPTAGPALKPTAQATDLVTVDERIFRYMRPIQYPDNDREFIVDHLFQTNYRNVRHWRMVPGPGCRAQKWQHGYTPIAFWDAEKEGSVLVLRGEVEADLTGYASLRVRCLAAKTAQVSVRADIDGAWVPIAPPAPGVNDYGEYVGAISGKRLHAVEIRFETSIAGPVSSAVMWVMLSKPGGPSPLPELDPAWPGMLVEEAPAEPRPISGIIFAGEELDDIRRRLHGPKLKQRWTDKVRSVEKWLETAPEDRASSVVASSTARYGRATFRVKPYPASAAVDLAYVGLVENRPEMLRHAARWGLTQTRCKRWVAYGIEALDGLSISHGRFAQSYHTDAMARVLDWAGSALTSAGRELVAKAIHELGVVDIDGIMQPGSYVWNCNQGLVFEKGRFAGAAAIRQWYPTEYPAREADARKMLTQCLAACIKPDGTGMEGPAYWHYTIIQVPALAFMLARASGEPVAAAVPPEVAASARWAWTNRRTDTSSFKMLTYSDSGYERGISAELLAFFGGPLQLPQYIPLARAAANSRTDPLFLQCIRALPATTPPLQAEETLTVFPDSGHVDIRQANPREGMRIYFLSGEWGGKSHGDRNSFMLEAFGRMLLLDRATAHYTHPLHHAMISAEAHNTVVADDLNQTKRSHSPGAHLLKAEERDGIVILESDAAPAWPELGEKVLRRLFHLRPATLVVEDVIAWKRSAVTHQYWQSTGEWNETDDGWVAEVGGVELCATILSGDGVTVTAAPYAIDGKLRSVHRLDVAVPQSRGTRVITLLRARRSAGTAVWPSAGEYDAKADVLRLRDRAGLRLDIAWEDTGPVIRRD